MIDFKLLARPGGKCDAGAHSRSQPWQGKGKISKNVTDIQTYRHFIIIYISPAWKRGKAK